MLKKPDPSPPGVDHGPVKDACSRAARPAVFLQMVDEDLFTYDLSVSGKEFLQD